MMNRICTIVAVLLVAAAPSSAQSREQRQMMADIRMLQQQTQELQVAIATLTQALQDQIKTVNTRARRSQRRHAQGLCRSEGHRR
jgi:tellurite resistance protein